MATKHWISGKKAIKKDIADSYNKNKRELHVSEALSSSAILQFSLT
jgi:hypothetical protein